MYDDDDDDDERVGKMGERKEELEKQSEKSAGDTDSWETPRMIASQTLLSALYRPPALFPIRLLIDD